MKKYLILVTVAISSMACNNNSVPSSTVSGPQVTASARQLTRITDDGVAEFQPSVSPDGTMLLYAIRDDNSENDGIGKWSLRLKRQISSPGFTPIIGDYTQKPSWMNDEGDFLFTYYTSNNLIAKSNINSLGITYVGQSNYGDFDYDPNVSLNGDGLIVMNTMIQDRDFICTVEQDGTNFTVLTEGMHPQWHPTGEKIIYHKLSGDYFQLFELDMQTLQSTQITSGDFHNVYAKYSPQGDHVVYISTKDAGNPHIFVMNASGKSITQLTLGKSKETQPDWGADGYIYFASTAGAKKKKKETTRAEKEKKVSRARQRRRERLIAPIQLSTKKDDKFSYNEEGYANTDIWRLKPVLR